MARSRARLVAVVGVVLALATAACSGGDPQWTDPGGPSSQAASTTPGAAQLTIVPSADAVNVSPGLPVSVGIINGTLNEVTLTSSDGKAVKGEFNATQALWSNTEQLGYNKKYTVKATATGADGRTLSDERSFTTLKPKNQTLPYLRANVSTLLDGGTFGVGQPIVVWFDEVIKDKAAAEGSLTVTTDPPGIVGGWRWLNAQEVHWRPKDYWPSGTKVTVTAKVYGRDLGGGLYGQQDRSATFTIGQKKIAIADSQTHRMKIYFDDQVLTSINGKTTVLVGGTNWNIADGLPISMGRGGSTTGDGGIKISFTTNSGPHVITTKSPTYHMTSASYGLSKGDFSYATDVKDAVRISGDGEFVHAAPWSTGQQGKANVSHGCINLAPDLANWFYNNFGAGDVVDVTGTSQQLSWTNGLGDWVLPWDEWVKGSAL
jgi:lipoprotein-anchoring transpeptidase ErfK/SrfK